MPCLDQQVDALFFEYTRKLQTKVKLKELASEESGKLLGLPAKT